MTRSQEVAPRGAQPGAAGAGPFFWMLYASAWCPFALVYASLLAAERAEPVWATMPATALSVTSAALLGATVWPLTRHLEAVEQRSRFWLTHLLAAAIFASCWIVSIYLRIRFSAGAPSASAYLSTPATGWQLMSGVWLYGVIAGVFHGLQARRRAGEIRQALAAAQLRQAEADALRVAAELRAIRARLNPHFFFNTLQALLPLVRSAPEDAAHALERFGGMMRYVLDEHGEQGLVSLAAELRFVRDYLALESLRLGWRLRVVEEIDPTALDAGLPPLTLQPLVENAVVHGIAARAAGGLLVLRVARTASMVSIEIEDDGPGVSATPSEESRGVGLSAVSQRLDLAFAGRAMLKVESSPGAGFRIRIEVPDDDDDQLPLAGGGSMASRVAAVECR